jgi:hypothetical protein
METNNLIFLIITHCSSLFCFLNAILIYHFVPHNTIVRLVSCALWQANFYELQSLLSGWKIKMPNSENYEVQFASTNTCTHTNAFSKRLLSFGMNIKKCIYYVWISKNFRKTENATILPKNHCCSSAILHL